MVGISRHLDFAEALKGLANQVINGTKLLFESNPPGAFTGQRNTKKDVQQRISLYDDMLNEVLAQQPCLRPLRTVFDWKWKPSRLCSTHMIACGDWYFHPK
jgi:hypothetical protein